MLPLTEPELTATVGVARSAALQGSSVARSCAAVAVGMRLDDVLDLAALTGEPGRP